MDPLDDRPQVGSFAVEIGALEHDGVDIDVLAVELGVEVAEELPDGAPKHGWRVLARHRGVVTVLGTPVDDSRQWWRLGQIVRGRGEPTAPRLSVHPTSFPRRPSKRDRAGALTLRWPEVTRSAPDLDLLMIDVVNAGDQRWYPQGDSFTVFAAIRRPDGSTPSVNFGFIAGQNPAMPLDPGEYSRVRVSIDSSQWQGLTPGRVELHPILVDLGLRSDAPLGVEVTEQDVQRHRPRRRND